MSAINVRPNNATYSGNAGFTLIELSIVLVIIGLIVGGVLVGQDLIKAAAIRATVSQIEKYNTAINTFKNKYGGLPGDLIPQTAASFGLFALSNPNGTEGLGDNNGLIEDGHACPALSGGYNNNSFCGEIGVFWRHLTEASLMDGSFGIIDPPLADTGAPTLGTALINQYLPTTRIGHGIMIAVISGNGANYFLLEPFLTVVGGTGYTVGKSGLTPIEANNIDSKIDDGMPESGAVVATALQEPAIPTPGYGPAYLIGAQSPSASTTSAFDDCVISTDGSGYLSSDTYNLIADSGGTDPSCGLAIRFQ